jgi:hypothetical protein
MADLALEVLEVLRHIEPSSSQVTELTAVTEYSSADS